MKTTTSLVLCISFFSAGVLADDLAHVQQQNWHQWRGPNANGVSSHGDPPVEWDEDTNIKWKAEVPGRGSSTPIVWGNQVFLLTAIKTDRVAESLPKLPEAPTRGGNATLRPGTLVPNSVMGSHLRLLTPGRAANAARPGRRNPKSERTARAR